MQNLKIHIITHQGIPYNFNISKDGTVRDLKLQIKSHLGLEINQQTLLYNRKELSNDDLKLSYFGVEDNDEIKLIISNYRDEFTISINMQGRPSFDIEVRSTDTLDKVREAIRSQYQLSFSEQSLFHCGTPLTDNNIMSTYNLLNRSMIQVVQKLICEMQLIARLMDGKTVAFEVTKTDRIIDIKKKIEQKLGLPVDEQSIMYNGIIMENDKTVDEYQITDKSHLNVVARLRRWMEIFAKTMDGKIVSFYVTKADRIIDIKKKIREEIGLHPKDQIIMHQEIILEDDRTVDEYQITEKSAIEVGDRLRGWMEIFAKTMDGKMVSLDVTKTDRIIDVKNNIQKKNALLPDEQKLVYQGRILEDNKTVEDYLIAEKDVINVVVRLRRWMEIFAKTMDGKIVSFYVTKADRIIDIKKKIREKIGLHPKDQKLLHQGLILEDDKSVDECLIVKKSVINIVSLLRGWMEISAKTMDGKIFSFDVTKTDRIIDIKKKIQEKIGRHPKDQKLLHQEVILEDDKTVNEYQIADKSVINVVNQLGGCMEIFAKTMDGKIFPFYVTNTDRIIYMKKKIQEKVGLHPKDQKLVYQEVILEDDKTVDEYQIAEKSVIEVSDRLRGWMEIFAKTLDGKTISFDVQKTDRIIDIKKKIQEKRGLSPGEQSIIFNGVILENDKTVDEYQITENSIINVVSRLKRWMEIFAKTLDGKIVSFYVTKADRIIFLKKKIQEKIGLHPRDQKLVNQDLILEDDKTVDEYQIANKCVIDVVDLRRCKMQLIVRSMDGKLVCFEVTKTDRIIDIKNKIQQKLGLPVDEQNIMYNGIIMENDKTVDEYQIEENSFLRVVPGFIRWMEIFAKTMDGKMVSLDVTKTYRIIDIKNKIQQKLELHPNNQKLMNQDIILEDDKTVDEYQIVDKCVIDVVDLRRLRVETLLKIVYKNATSNCKININDTIANLKMKIQENFALQVDKQILKHGDTLLNDNNKTLSDYNIVSGSIINVTSASYCIIS